jgi:predicted alpha-1,2-mannosidase
LEVNKELLNWRMHFFKSTFLFAILAISYFPLIAQKDYTKLVNPMVGTGGHGHTFPGPVVPFGMVQVGPDTRVDGSWDGCSGYHYSDSIIYGFSHTHLSGTGCSDYGDIMIMPINRNHFFTYAAETEVKNYASKFSHTNETASPGYYAVTLDKSKVKVELTASNRAAKHRYTFKDYATPAFILDLNHRDQLLQGKVTVVNDSTVEGYRYSKAWATNQKVYFRMVFSKKFKAHYMFSDSSIKLRNMQSNGKLKVIFEFPTGTQNIEVTVALSGVSEKGAAANYSAEAANISFDQMRKMAQETWNKELSKIEVKGGTIEQQRIF